MPRSRRLSTLLFYSASLLLLASFFLSTFTIVNNYKLTREWHWADVPDYLNLGLRIASGKEGIFITDGNRHPLYSMILSLFAEKDINYFVKAKLVSMVLGNIFMLLVFLLFLIKNRKIEAIIILLILSNNIWLQWHSADIRCEMLYTILLFLAWYSFYPCFQGKLTFLIPGILTGAAFLSKYSALLIAYSFFITYWIIYKLAGLRWEHMKKLVLFTAGFLLIAWPIFKWNYQTYGNPLYNINTTHYMWFNDLTELDKSIHHFPQTLPTMRTYFQKNNLPQVLLRLSRGVYGEYFELMDALAEKYFIFYIFIAIIGLIVILGRHSLTQVFAAKKELYTLSLTLFLLNYLALSWYYVVFADVRFISPVIPVVYIALIDFAVSLSRKTTFLRTNLWERGKSQTVLITLFYLFIVFISIKSIQTAKIDNPFSARFANKDALLNRLRDF
jgi:hypothetical protein